MLQSRFYYTRRFVLSRFCTLWRTGSPARGLPQKLSLFIRAGRHSYLAIRTRIDFKMTSLFFPLVFHQFAFFSFI